MRAKDSFPLAKALKTLREEARVLDLCEVMAEAIEMVRNDCESTPVSRARALAYCCGVDAKLIEMAAISERQQPEQSKTQK